MTSDIFTEIVNTMMYGGGGSYKSFFHLVAIQNGIRLRKDTVTSLRFTEYSECSSWQYFFIIIMISWYITQPNLYYTGKKHSSENGVGLLSK